MMKRWVVCTISVATYCMLILFCICYQMYVVHGAEKKCNAGEFFVAAAELHTASRCAPA